MLINCLIVTGCTETNTGDGCEWDSYIQISHQDTLTPATDDQIKAHNHLMKQFCYPN